MKARKKRRVWSRGRREIVNGGEEDGGIRARKVEGRRVREMGEHQSLRYSFTLYSSTSLPSSQSCIGR